MTVVLYLVIAAAVLAFVVASLERAVRYARAPLHLRWELYPVPHEKPARVAYGGSYFETSEWWKVPRHFSLIGELRFMVPEILFLKALRENNRPLWFRSFPFHFGLYLLTGSCGLILLTAGLSVLQGRPISGVVGTGLRETYTLGGVSGLVLALVGAAALLHRRLTAPDLRSYTTPGDILNLLFFLVAFGLLGVGYLLRPEGSAGVLTIVTGILRWDPTPQVAPVFAAGLVVTSVLTAYIPLTHMSHFVAKYFTYHSVRWDDAPLRDNRRIAAAFAEYLTYRPTWSAPHMKAGGATTWAEVAATNPNVGGEKRS